MRGLAFAVILTTVLVFCANAHADVAGDIAAGLPMSQVIANALDAGLSIETVVAQSINAGADPATVVAAAIATRASAAAGIVNIAVTLKPGSAVSILNAALGAPGVNPGFVITAVATAVSGNVDALNNLRSVALNDGIPPSTVDTAILVATTSPAGPAPGGPGAGGQGGNAGALGSGWSGGGLASPSR
jgi:hypothetical protein